MGNADQPEVLVAFLRSWLGQWPPTAPVSVVGYAERSRPGWDGAIHDVIGVGGPLGGVVSVPPDLVDAVIDAAGDWADLPKVLPAALGRPTAPAFLGVFRWCTTPTDLPDVGKWLPAEDPRLPEWLKPFGGKVLVVLEDGEYAAGVGLKRHNEYGVELAVGTDPAYRGRGLAARLCAQAARHVLADGAVPIYLHDPVNVASAHTGAAAGFPDDGWQVLGMGPAGPESPTQDEPPTTG